MDSKKVIVLPVLVLALSLLWRWMYPYPEPLAKRLLPPVLPSVSNAAEGDYLADILTHNIWHRERGQANYLSGALGDGNRGGAEEGGQGDNPDIDSQFWRLLGVSLHSMKPVVIIDNVVGGGVSTYQLGDELPDGSKISKIMPFGIQVLKSGENEKIYLFGKK